MSESEPARRGRATEQSLRSMKETLSRDDVKGNLAELLKSSTAKLAGAEHGVVGVCKEDVPYKDLYVIMLDGKSAYTCSHRPPHTRGTRD